MKKHFVTFFSPGTIVAETTTKPIDSWDIDEAVEIAKGIIERYNAVPYGFQFSTRERSEGDLDSHVSKESCFYFLGGVVVTLSDLENMNNPEDRILISNMRINNIPAVVVNTNSWKWTQPLGENDVVLDVKL